ncbi:GAF domain-containing protein [Streptomyces sp. NPDC002680]|uniref:GAF domain-containing protein n=1 Tax=Streptomyces sp. NPDC002680 TaxID=3364659 RepID=UPI0036745FB9
MTHPTHLPLPSRSARRQPGVRPETIVPHPGTIQLGQEISAAQARKIAEQQARDELIRSLGIPTSPDRLMDEFARHLAEVTGMLYGFVNIFLGEQTFVGLHNPPPDSGHLVVPRTMRLDHGWCPAVMERRKALPLPDVHASPRFSGNYVADSVGIRSYFGSPLIHGETGIALGTVCTIDPEARALSDARRLLDAVKASGAEILHALTSGAPAH